MIQVLETTTTTRTQPATADEVEAFLTVLDRLTTLWRDGELSDEEFQIAKAKLLNLDTAPDALLWPEYIVIPLD